MYIYLPEQSMTTIEFPENSGIFVTQDINLALQQPYKVCCLPFEFDQPGTNWYVPGLDLTLIEKFDAHIVTSIEQRDFYSVSWFNNLPYTNKYFIKGYFDLIESDQEWSRPWWVFRVINENPFIETRSLGKPFKFDALLGSRRPGRDYVFQKFLENNILDTSIVTYRDCFNVYPGAYIKTTMYNSIPDNYVSPNLDPAWETSSNVTHTVSHLVPYEIYKRTNYSIVNETTDGLPPLFITEKLGKPIFAKRLFILFGQPGMLQLLRNLGFKTFSNVIDESYDQCEDIVNRFNKAFNQVLRLQKANDEEVHREIFDIVEHNHNRLIEYYNETKKKYCDLIYRLCGADTR